MDIKLVIFRVMIAHTGKPYYRLARGKAITWNLCGYQGLSLMPGVHTPRSWAFSIYACLRTISSLADPSRLPHTLFLPSSYTFPHLSLLWSPHGFPVIALTSRARLTNVLLSRRDGIILTPFYFEPHFFIHLLHPCDLSRNIVIFFRNWLINLVASNFFFQIKP